MIFFLSPFKAALSYAEVISVVTVQVGIHDLLKFKSGNVAKEACCSLGLKLIPAETAGKCSIHPCFNCKGIATIGDACGTALTFGILPTIFLHMKWNDGDLYASTVRTFRAAMASKLDGNLSQDLIYSVYAFGHFIISTFL
ncbi:hypothetical protein V6N13_087134 [Hibiscus sabdariffa]|uniref:Uncharacterized protein n=1 Tax=Hibiscus sabdariffa TaxID=183260 RepID=A0ABR2FVB1_9ROSI